MKIITNNYKPPAAEVFPHNILCQVCQSIIEMTIQADIKQIEVAQIKSFAGETEKSTLAPGFICPACGGKNILG